MRTLFISALTACLVLIGFGCNEAAKENTNLTTADPVLSSMINNIRNYPDSTGLVDKIIDTLANRGDADAAASWCDSLVIRDSVNNFIYTLVKADLFRNAKKYDAAIAAYKEYLAKKPEEPLVFMTLANTMAEAGSPETLDFCNSVWQRFPTPQARTGLSYIRGVYYNTKKQFAEARQWLDSTIRYDYAFADAYLEKGYSWYDEGNFQEAAKAFAKLTEVSPKNADGWYWLGKSYDTLHMADKAIAAYQRALMHDGSIAEAQEAIERLGNPK